MANLLGNPNGWVVWTQLLELLGIKFSSRVLPAIVQCPFCRKHQLEILEDEISKGQWFACRHCKRSGDMFELASFTWGISLPAAIAKLSELFGLQITSQLADKYCKKFVNPRRRMSAFWRRARQEGIYSSTNLTRLIHELGLRCETPPDRRKLGPDRLMGGSTKLLVEAAFERQTKGMGRMFRGEEWNDILVIPFYDLPQRICAFLFIGRKGDPEKDFLFFRVPMDWSHIRAIKGYKNWFEAGLAMHPDALKSAKDWNNHVVAINDPAIAVKLQIKHFKISTLPLPIVSWYWNSGKSGNACYTDKAWKLLCNNKVVLWMPVMNMRTIEQAIRNNMQISTAGPYHPDGFKDYVQQQHSERLCRLIIDTAQPWPKALAKSFGKMEDSEVEDVLYSLQLEGIPLDKIIARCGTTTKKRIRDLTKSIQKTIMFDNYTISEQGDCWYVQGRQFNRPELLLDAVLSIDHIIHSRKTSQEHYKGVIRYQGVEIPFCEEAKVVKKKTVEWMQKVLLEHKLGYLDSNPSFARKILAIAQRFHAPKLSFDADHVGWDDHHKQFIMPTYTIGERGDIEKLERHIVMENAPATRLPKPGTVTPLDFDLVAADDKTAKVTWATLACVLANVLAPALNQTKCGIGLVGQDAETSGLMIAEAAGCVPFRFEFAWMKTSLATEEDTNAWPIALSLGPKLVPTTRSNWIENTKMRRHNCIMPLDWWTAKAKAVLGGWNIVYCNDPLSVSKRSLAAIRKIVPTYLRSVISRRHSLGGYTCDSWAGTILQDLAKFAETNGGRPDLIREGMGVLHPDCESGNVDALLDILYELIHMGRIRVAKAGFHEGKDPGVLHTKKGILINHRALMKELKRLHVLMADPLKITRALADAEVLVGDVDAGWIVSTAWWIKQFKKLRAERSGILKLHTSS